MPDAIQHVIKFGEGKTAIKLGRSTDISLGRFSFIKSQCLLHTVFVLLAVLLSVGSPNMGTLGRGFSIEAVVSRKNDRCWAHPKPLELCHTMTKIFEDIEEQLECKVVLPDIYD